MIKHIFYWLFNLSSPTIYKLSFYQTSSYRDYYTITKRIRKKYDIGYQMVKAFEKGLSYERK